MRATPVATFVALVTALVVLTCVPALSAELREDIVDCSSTSDRFEIVLCSNHGAFDLINHIHQMLYFAPDLDAAQPITTEFRDWMQTVQNRCMGGDLRLASDCIYDLASGEETKPFLATIQSLYANESDIEGDEECDGCSVPPDIAADTTATPASIELSLGKQGDLIGEHYTLDHFRLILADWKQHTGMAHYGASLPELLVGNTLTISTAVGAFDVFFESTENVVWIKSNLVVGRGAWSVSTADVDQQICFHASDASYCRFLYTPSDLTDHLWILLQSDDAATSWNYWDARFTQGRSPETELALQAEPARQALRERGIRPEDVDELYSLYTGYQSAEQCNSHGLEFDTADIEALARAAKRVEARITSTDEIAATWERASALTAQTSMIFSASNYQRAIETCQGMRFFLQARIVENRVTSTKPF